jgi:hypothetical protein
VTESWEKDDEGEPTVPANRVLFAVHHKARVKKNQQAKALAWKKQKTIAKARSKASVSELMMLIVLLTLPVHQH